MRLSSLTSTERACACLLGLAVGDALGFPLEGLSARQIARRYPDRSRYHFLGRRGYVSDDTEQAVMVAEALLEGKPVEGFARRLVLWFWTIPPGIGMATVKACLKWSVGWRQGAPSAGNGAAMRAASVGLWHAYTDELAREVALVTHTDPRGVDGARLISYLVARLVRGEAADWPVELPLDARLRAALEKAWDLRGEPPETRARELGTTGYVLHSVPLACAALWSGAPFREALDGVLRQGGDADSNGAIAGALLGARWGEVPDEWTDLLEPNFGRPRLEALARGLVTGQLGDYRPPGFVSRRAREALIKAGVGIHVLRRLIPW